MKRIEGEGTMLNGRRRTIASEKGGGMRGRWDNEERRETDGWVKEGQERDNVTVERGMIPADGSCHGDDGRTRGWCRQGI